VVVTEMRGVAERWKLRRMRVPWPGGLQADVEDDPLGLDFAAFVKGCERGSGVGGHPAVPQDNNRRIL
jgi:hypothetical protein